MMKLPRMIATAAIAFAFGAIALFLSLPVQQAEAASRTFHSDTTITSDQTIASGETWTVYPGVKLTIHSGVTISNYGTIDNKGTIGSDGTIYNSDSITNEGTIYNNFGGYIDNSPIGTIYGVTIN